MYPVSLLPIYPVHPSRLNDEMVVARPIKRDQDIAEAKTLMGEHAEKIRLPTSQGALK